MQVIFYQGASRIKTVDIGGKYPVFINSNRIPYVVKKGSLSTVKEWEAFKKKGV